MVGSEVVGSEVVGSDVVGSDVVGSDVVGSDVVGLEVAEPRAFSASRDGHGVKRPPEPAEFGSAAARVGWQATSDRLKEVDCVGPCLTQPALIPQHAVTAPVDALNGAAAAVVTLNGIARNAGAAVGACDREARSCLGGGHGRRWL